MDSILIGIVAFVILAAFLFLTLNIITAETHACIMMGVLIRFIVEFYTYRNKNKQKG